MNSEKSKTLDPFCLGVNLRDKIKLKRSEKYIALSSLSVFYKRKKNINRYQKNNRFKISAAKWNNEFKSPDGSYLVAKIQHCFYYVI